MNKQIEQIRAEIERRKKICEGVFERESDTYYQGKAVAYGELLSFIDSQQDEQSSRDLEQEIATWIPAHIKGDADKDTMDVVKWWGENVARHFYELGQQSKIKPSKDLEEAAEEYTQRMLESWIFDSTGCRPPRESFIAGAKWQKEQMLKDAVERVVKVDAGGYPYIDTTELYDYEKDKPLAKADDKVKIILVKKEDEK